MPNGDVGYRPTTEFGPYYQAALRKIRAGAARERRLAGRAVARAGVRTAGVGTIPITGITREQIAQESQLAGGMAREQALTGIQERRIGEERVWRTGEAAKQREFQLKLGKIQRAAQRKAARSQMWGQIIGGGLGLGAAFIPGGR